MTNKITFVEALEEDDWGLIIGKDGVLKGLFIPEGSDEDEVPESIIDICIHVFGIDPAEFEEETSDGQTLH